MSSHQEGICQVVETPSTVPAGVTLTVLLTMVLAALPDLVRGTVGTMDAVLPTYPSDFLVTFRLIYKVVDTEHGSKISGVVMEEFRYCHEVLKTQYEPWMFPFNTG
jgi:hypothetical protein